MATIEIYDEDEHGILAFDLAKLLEVVEPFGIALEWYFLEFEPVDLTGPNGSSDIPPPWVSELYQRLRKEPNSVKVEWEMLKQFACHVKQTMDATLIGVFPGTPQPIAPLNVDNPQYEIVIQCIDTSLWALTCRNQELIGRIRSSFRETKIV